MTLDSEAILTGIGCVSHISFSLCTVLAQGHQCNGSVIQGREDLHSSSLRVGVGQVTMTLQGI